MIGCTSLPVPPTPADDAAADDVSNDSSDVSTDTCATLGDERPPQCRLAELHGDMLRSLSFSFSGSAFLLMLLL